MRLTLTLVTFAALQAACASLIDGSNQTITLKTVPEAASFGITNKAGEKIHAGTTPVTLSLKRGAGYFQPESYTIVIYKPGFVRRELTLNGGVNGWYFGNLLVGGLIGMLIVDPLTGAMFSLAPSPVDVTLDAVTHGSPVEKTSSLTVVLTSDVSAELLGRAKLVARLD